MFRRYDTQHYRGALHKPPSLPQRNGMASAALEKHPAAPLNRDDRGGKYLVFELGREEFGIRVLQVREIMGVRDITSLPQTPAHVKGVINQIGRASCRER